MKKICYVVTLASTIEAFFIKQLKYLAGHGFDVSVICSNDGKIKDELGQSITYIPVEIPRGMSLIGSLKSIKELKKVFIKEQFDLIQYSTPNAAFYASIAAKSVKCKVRNYHIMGFKYLGATGIERDILNRIERVSCYNSTDIECVSKSNLEIGIEEGLFTVDKACVVWNGSSGGVDCKRFDYFKRAQWRNEIRNELGYSKDDFIYGFFGRVTKDKGINELLDAFIALNNDSKLLLIGQIEGLDLLNPNLINIAQKSENIKFHDAVIDVERYYAAIDVLILPSYREGFGNVVIEAGAMGIPAIVTNIPGPINAIDNGRTALTVRVKDSEDLKEKMRQIREIDYQVMGDNAAKFTKEKFDSEVVCRKIYERKIKLLEKIE